jgi:hypothetical protein
MFHLFPALKESGTKSVRGLQAALSSSRSPASVVELVQTQAIHQAYIKSCKRNGRLGWPSEEVKFDAKRFASRQYRGGEIHVLEGTGGAAPFATRAVSIAFLGFHCYATQGGPGSDEPYFIISIDRGNGSPLTNMWRFENVDKGTEQGPGAFLVKLGTPDPMALRVVAYENDQGDPNETEKKIQSKLVELSNEAGAVAGAAEAADGPAAGAFAAAGNALDGPLGSVIAIAIVGIFGLGDDYIGQSSKILFMRPDEVKTPPKIGKFQGNDYNVAIIVDGKGEGKYELYFDVQVFDITPTPL